jgi:hypothetical protein
MGFKEHTLLPRKLVCSLRNQQLLPTRFVLSVSVNAQTMRLFEKAREQLSGGFPRYQLRKKYVVSTSAYGIGQIADSNQTPLGLHRVARKIGGGYPIGTVFRSRKEIGRTWQGLTTGSIAHRILWLEGLEPGYNCGGKVDTFNRYIYIHGFGDETTLGRPFSHGCIHMSAQDLMPLYDRLPAGTMVWIDKS